MNRAQFVRSSKPPKCHEGNDRARFATLLAQFGTSDISFACLANGNQFFFADDAGGVAFYDTGAAWVTVAGPVAEDSRVLEVAREFEREAKLRGRRVCWFAVEATFAKRLGRQPLAIGQVPVIDPRGWSTDASANRALRTQLRRAQKQGLRIVSVDSSITQPPHPLYPTLCALVNRWQSSKSLPPMAFVAQVDWESHSLERRYWLAFRHDKLVAFLVASPVFGRNGWLLDHLIRGDDAPNGSSEHLVHEAICSLKREACNYVSLGPTPLSGDIASPLRWIRTLGGSFYNFEGVRRFRAKFRPTSWTNIYLLPSSESNAFRASLDLIDAFTRNDRVGFFGRALRSFIERATKSPQARHRRHLQNHQNSLWNTPIERASR